MSAFDTIESLLEDQLKDIYSAEKQLTKAIPKMAKAASNPKLQQALQEHLVETEGQIGRLEQIAEKMEIKLTVKKCKAMEGLVEEGKEAIECDGDANLVDAGIVAAAQRVEHYEISAYGSAAALAEKLGLSEVVELLRETEEEEASADEKLTAICEDELLANFEGSSDSSEEEEEEESDDDSDSPRSAARQLSKNSARGMTAKPKR